MTPPAGLLDRLLAKHSPDDLEALAAGRLKLVTVGGKSAADRQRDRRARKKAIADG